MNGFQRKMAEHLSLIATLVMDINCRSDEFSLNLDICGQISGITIYAYESLGMRRKNPGKETSTYQLWGLRGYFDQDYGDKPYKRCLTTDQIITVLHQIRRALIEGRTHETTEHHTATDSEHTATTRLDQRNGIDGALLPPAERLRHGSVKGTGGQPAGAVSSMA